MRKVKKDKKQLLVVCQALNFFYNIETQTLYQKKTTKQGMSCTLLSLKGTFTFGLFSLMWEAKYSLTPQSGLVMTRWCLFISTTNEDTVQYLLLLLLC